jgi:uncharacterized protein YbjT (DUF2867 family)
MSSVTVFGGSGFLGRAIVRRLVEGGAVVRVAVRHPERVAFLTEADAVTAVRADVWDEGSVAPALAGADAVVNTVGHYVERGGASFEAVHGQGALHVARAAAAAGIGRLVHISGIGADERSPSSYVRARAIGERLVREAFPQATILRPSVMFGPDDAFFNPLAAIARVTPVLPLFGSGAVRLQPAYVGDVAEAVAQALALEAARGKTYELGGPRAYSYRALLELLLEQLGRRRLLLPMPYRAWELLAVLLTPLPNRPISRDQVVLMKQDNVVGPGALGFADLGIAPHSVEEILPSYLGLEPGPAGPRAPLA